MSFIPPISNGPGVSPLLNVALRLFEPPAAVSAVPAKDAFAMGRYDFDIDVIVALLNKINPKGARYEDVLGFSAINLIPEEKAILYFLQRDKSLFQRFAAMDGDAKSLSPEDVHLAAQLTGKTVMLSSEDLAGLKPPPPLSSSPLQDVPAQPRPQNQAEWTESAVRLLQKLNPQGISLADFKNLTPAALPLSVPERGLLSFLQSPNVLRLLQQASRPKDGYLTPEMLRMLSGLLWNPAAYANRPLVFLTDEEPHEAVDGLNPFETVTSSTAVQFHVNRQPKTPDTQALRRVRISAERLQALCEKISPDGNVTLGMLRRYQPANAEEAFILQFLNQRKIFQALSQLDHAAGALSLEDIRLAVSHGALILSDAHIALVITDSMAV